MGDAGGGFQIESASGGRWSHFRLLSAGVTKDCFNETQLRGTFESEDNQHMYFNRIFCSHLRPTLAALSAIAALAFPAHAADAKVNESLLQKNFPFQGACISATCPAKNTAMKGLAIRLPGDAGANVLFDTDLCRMAAGWTGGYISTRGVTYDGSHGGHPAIVGTQKFGTAVVPGVSVTSTFKDSRSEPFGPMDSTVARWGGLRLLGDRVQLEYIVAGNVRIEEQPSAVSAGEQTVFLRNFQIKADAGRSYFGKNPKITTAFSILLADVEGIAKDDKGRLEKGVLILGGKETATWIKASGLPKGVTLVAEEGRVSLRIAAGTVATQPFQVAILSGSNPDAATFEAATQTSAVFADFSKGGPVRWPQTVETKGTVSTADAAYVVDNITTPINNPWNRRVRIGGMDFFADGTRAAVSTWDGDLWIVSGIDANLQNLRWKRFASGMYETLGLRIINDVVYTSGRDQLTRYTDVNGDGEADYYENFNNQVTSTEGFHEFLFDLQTDAQGNFYFAKAGPVKGGGRGFETISRDAGTLMKVSANGKKFETVATGFRAPNGIGVNPWNGQITTGDNEGTWVPTCPVNWVKPGGFYGVEDLAHGADVKSFRQPLTWMSHDNYDNSGGGQVWVDSDKWGPFSKRLLHMSYGQCSLFLVMHEEINGQIQGGVVKFPLKFTSSAMRGRFNKKDGQLYVAGLQGWQTKAVKISGFDRVRYTGKPVYSVQQMKVTSKGLRLTFTHPLDAKEASDIQNFSARRWNYNRTSDYGSQTFKVKNPTEKGRETVAITGAKVSDDGLSVDIEIEDFRLVNQLEIKFQLKAKDGSPIEQEFQCSVNVIPGGVVSR